MSAGRASGDPSRRVVITGFGALSPIGIGLDAMSEALREERSGVVHLAEWSKTDQLATRLAGPVQGATQRTAKHGSHRTKTGRRSEGEGDGGGGWKTGGGMGHQKAEHG